MKILVLFDGAGLARLGLEQAGHDCTGVELCREKHHLSTLVGSGNCILGDVLDFEEVICDYEGVWMSPPCQRRSMAIHQRHNFMPYEHRRGFDTDYVEWCQKLMVNYNDTWWLENVFDTSNNDWGLKWNAHQFLEKPIQQRKRIVGGRYSNPDTYREFSHAYAGICPCITGTEYKGCATDNSRASRFYGRKLTIQECAYHQGFDIPRAWHDIPEWFMSGKINRAVQWRNQIYEGIGNGVPVYMARAFGEAK